MQATVQIYICLPPLPQTVSVDGPYFQTDEGGEEIKVIATYHFDQALQSSIRTMISDRYQVFTEISGFTMAIEEWHSVEEAIDSWIA
ncbi:MAG: hypothetical protein KJ950_10985 [Proteobacteria bacterium]|nr:hypothetical protein [Pseudomonadota bacterium]